MGEAQRACYSASELTEALHKLRMIDLARLRRISQYLAHGRQQVGDDALQEAFRRCMSGTRKWPRDLDLVPFLVGVVRSVVEGDTKARRRRRETSLETVGGELSSCDVSAEDQLIRSEDEAAEIARAAETKARVLALFNDDEVAQIIAGGIMEGLLGEELRTLTDLDETGFASKRRLIRRRISKAIPGSEVS